jgi:hypothetical protein
LEYSSFQSVSHSTFILPSHPRSLQSDEVKPVKKHNGYGKYYIAPQTVTYQNDYWDPKTQRTYKSLYNYYKAPEGRFSEGYVSKKYGLTYYDGYGYNYYSDKLGYYEYSRHPPIPSGGDFDVKRFLITLLCMVAALLVFVLIYYKLEKNKLQVPTRKPTQKDQ